MFERVLALENTQKLYSLSYEALFKQFQTTERGLSDEEATARLKKYGPNKLTEKKGISPLQIYFNQFKSILIIILIAAAFLTFLVYLFGERNNADLIEGGLILAIVLMITILGFVQEYRAEKAIEALKKLLAFKAKVVRAGTEKEIETVNLVPGDVVILEEGDKIPADIRLFDIASLQTGEASLTGESTPISKSSNSLTGNLQIADQKNMVFSGTAITSGRGHGVVVGTGDNTEIGKIATFVAETKDEQTPIQKRLNKLGTILGWGTIVISAFIFLFILFFSAEHADLTLLQKVLQSFIAAVALAVAAIPEGLPAVVTISLAFGTQRMLKKNALVRKLTSMETLGSVDVICADKTGTLTGGEMMVREIYLPDGKTGVDGKTYSVSGHGYDTDGEFQINGAKADPNPLNLILKAGLNCNNAKLDDSGRILGDPTEAALIVSANKSGVKNTGKRIHEIPFNSERKMMSVIVEEGPNTVVYSKGAPEVILNNCTKVISEGKEITLTEETKKKILAENSKMAGKALRVLGFAYKKIVNPPTGGEEKNTEKSLTFIGLQAMMDPPRAGMKDLITKSLSSGIDVVMITGDHLITATAVASEIGIKGDAINGNELESMSDKEFMEKVEKIKIYARVNPEHKFRIVEALKKKGHIVAMTGDGVNDAPALKKADIGIAMGINGTDVAKEASDMVLLDDRFSTIIAAIEEGRGIFQNIRKFVDYLLSSNIGEVLVVFLALIIFKNIPLTAVMLLWINVVTDGLPAIALGLDPAEKGILNYSPRKFQEQIINARVWVEILIFGVVLTIATLGIFYINLPEGLNEARAAAFMAIIVYELVRLVNIRSDYKISWRSNIWLVLAIASSVLMQIAIVYITPLANLFEISPIDTLDWVYIAITSLLMFFLLKIVDKVLNTIPLFSTKTLWSKNSSVKE